MFEGLVFHYYFARQIRRYIQGQSWREAWKIRCDHRTGHDDPIEAAGAYVAALRRRHYPSVIPSASKTAS